jgi:3-oxoacyl-[acyl-carrier-protein] synthase III
VVLFDSSWPADLPLSSSPRPTAHAEQRHGSRVNTVAKEVAGEVGGRHKAVVVDSAGACAGSRCALCIAAAEVGE